MKKFALPEDLQQEFKEFMEASPIDPPQKLFSTILGQIHKRMSPSPFLVFAKIALIVAFVGVFNLTLCPQFGLSFARESGLMQFFMSFGEHGCRIACGIFFLGSGLFVATLVLQPEDIRVARKTRFIQISALGALALVGFVALGGDVYFKAAIFWLLGSVIGGLCTLEVGFVLKKWAVKLNYA